MMLYRRLNKGFTMDEHKIQFVRRQWREFRYDGTDTFCEAWNSIFKYVAIRRPVQ